VVALERVDSKGIRNQSCAVQDIRRQGGGMKLPFGKPGISRFVFVALLLVFNWPVLSIPAPGNVFAWLFIVWGLAIALLFLVAQGVGSGQPAEPATPPSRTDAKPGAKPGAGLGAGPGAGPGGEGGDV
jgi:hypothetical protein